MRLANLHRARVDCTAAARRMSSTRRTSRLARLSAAPTLQRRRAADADDAPRRLLRRHRRRALLLLANLYGRPAVKPQRRRRRRANYPTPPPPPPFPPLPAAVTSPLQLAHAAPPKPWVSPWVQHVPERGGYTFWAPTSTSRRPSAAPRLPRCATRRVGYTVESTRSRARARRRSAAARRARARLRVITKGNAFDLCEPGRRAARAAPRLLRRVPRARLGAAASTPSCNHPPARCSCTCRSTSRSSSRVGQPRVWPREPAALARAAALLRAIADPRNVVAANNLYDAEYIRYYAGVQAEYVPSFCGHVSAFRYAPGGKPVLLARNHNNPAKLYACSPAAAAERPTDRVGGGVSKTFGAAPLRFVRTEDAYPGGRVRAARGTRRSSSCRTPSR